MRYAIDRSTKNSGNCVKALPAARCPLPAALCPLPSAPSRRLHDQVADRIPSKHYSMRTQQACCDWVWHFILCHDKRHPREDGRPGSRSPPHAPCRHRARRGVGAEPGEACVAVAAQGSAWPGASVTRRCRVGQRFLVLAGRPHGERSTVLVGSEARNDGPDPAAGDGHAWAASDTRVIRTSGFARRGLTPPAASPGSGGAVGH